MRLVLRRSLELRASLLSLPKKPALAPKHLMTMAFLADGHNANSDICNLYTFPDRFLKPFKKHLSMLTTQETANLKEELTNCARPLFIFHDDPDGLASFLLCYRLVREGRGLPVKAYPRVTAEPYARKAEEFGADKIFILDVAMVEQEFIDAVKVPVIWIDHHSVLERDRVKYFNPQKRGINTPTPVMMWQVVGEERPQDLWIAVVGSIGDWYFPDFATEFQQASELLPKNCINVQDALFNSPIGTLVKVFSFNLKGSMADVVKSVKILTRIDDPYDILEQRTPQAKLLWKKYQEVNKEYEQMLSNALKHDSDDKLFVYTYADDKLSLTKDLSNELLYKLNKIIIVGRERAGEVRCSLRAPGKINLAKALERALIGVEGYGGGHEQACGAAIKKENFKQFLENLRKELKL
ncbi:DHHA1 domain protein [uncultured archaeon]|nr:DHHA1 domain protein [uncultured archaeon]